MQSNLRTLAVVLVVMFGCRAADSSKPFPEPVTLNADDYRPEIIGIDRLLFSTKPYDETRRVQLAATLEGLASRITVGSDSRFLKM